MDKGVLAQKQREVIRQDYKISTGLTRHPANHEKSCESCPLADLPDQALNHRHELLNLHGLRDVCVVTRRERAYPVLRARISSERDRRNVLTVLTFLPAHLLD